MLIVHPLMDEGSEQYSKPAHFVLRYVPEGTGLNCPPPNRVIP